MTGLEDELGLYEIAGAILTVFWELVATHDMPTGREPKHVDDSIAVWAIMEAAFGVLFMVVFIVKL